MRIRELEDLLLRNQAGLGKLQMAPQPTGFVHCAGLKEAQSSLQMLDQVPGLQALVATAKTTPLFLSANDIVIVPSEVANQISSILQQASAIVKSMLDAIKLINIPAQSPYSLNIKLPATSSLDELIAVLKLCQQIFDRPVHDLVGENIRLEGCDRGSFWLELAVATPIAFGVIAKMLDVVKRYRTDRLQLDYASEILRTKRIHNDHLQTLQQGTQSQLNAFAETYADEVIREHSQEGADPAVINETRTVIVNSIKELDRLIDKGMEVQRAFNAPVEVQKLLPQTINATTIAPPQLPANAETSASRKQSS